MPGLPWCHSAEPHLAGWREWSGTAILAVLKEKEWKLKPMKCMTVVTSVTGIPLPTATTSFHPCHAAGTPHTPSRPLPPLPDLLLPIKHYHRRVNPPNTHKWPIHLVLMWWYAWRVVLYEECMAYKGTQRTHKRHPLRRGLWYAAHSNLHTSLLMGYHTQLNIPFSLNYSALLPFSTYSLLITSSSLLSNLHLPSPLRLKSFAVTHLVGAPRVILQVQSIVNFSLLLAQYTLSSLTW